MPPTLATSKIAVIGLGYVGLPLAVAFGKYFNTLGFDVKAARVKELKAHLDSTREAADHLCPGRRSEMAGFEVSINGT